MNIQFYKKSNPFFSMKFISIICFLILPELYAVGIFQPAHNARYGGMAGVNIGIGGSPLDIATNPANLSMTEKSTLEFGIALPYIRSSYKDRFIDPDPSLVYENNKNYNILAPLPYIGWAIPINDKWTYGGGLFIPGGGNAQIDGIYRTTPNGQTLNQWSGVEFPQPIGDSKRVIEEYSTTFFVVKFTNAISYKLGDLSIGVGVEGLYSKQNAFQKYYDPTRTVEIPGQGFDYQSRNAFSMGGIFGLSYKINPEWKIGYSYQTRAILPWDGRMQVGNNNPNFYRRTGVSATFELPERHGLGISWGNESFRIGTDFLYYNYGSYTKKFDQILEDPWFPTPAGRAGSVTQNVNYYDSWSAALGTEIFSGDLTYRLGFRYNTGVVREDGISALQAGIMVQELVAAGLGWKFGSWRLDVAFNYLLSRRVTGNRTGDWAIAHTLFNLQDFRPASFSHSLKSDVPAILIGLNKEF
ncbi:OmpP1/FadL family transporter [Leptospira sp. GIMC2001]|uniref:OmpP1/FadL family transporter n=1 Tax=Leptospira sp. GIMC2001 TaxID=1513297 RepID=UPI003FA53273